MRALHIHTVEQLANLSEQGMGKLGMGGREKVNRAKLFLEHAAKMAGGSQLQAELEKARDEIAALRSQVEQLVAAAAKPKRGRNAEDE